ncbi:pancreatic triacylglycerol lipase-like [Colletes gigas]|uniref:pancreatic triacylglycerol lipase-like n=1 Tax=Colletes gigas TaxID=935657 RepID=UPI001C9B432F|nr:pancreatic triacylglycerol lipase-like [Colletes gigas]
MVVPALALIYPSLIGALLQANYTIMPDETGTAYLVKLDHAPLTLNEIKELADNIDTITFTLFTRQNPTNGQRLELNNVNSVSSSHWNSNRPTVIVTHGWKSSGNSNSCTMVRDAYIKAMDCNVIIVDWSTIANNLVYSTVAKSVPAVADRVASFSSFLRSRMNLRASTTKMIGHSLGAHVVGLAGRKLANSGVVSEITGLDPAKPMFESKGPDGRIDSSQARIVEIIHTAAGKLGLDKAVGTSDFYANGGSSQPGCSTDLLGSCAHSRSYQYFSESVVSPRAFPSTPVKGDKIEYMGGPNLSSSATGSYNFKTSSQPPYAPGG